MYRRRCVGFTLVELALVLIIITVLLGGMLVPLSAQMDQRSVAETNKTISEAREALIGFAASRSAGDGRPYLPCPDTDNDGRENRSGPLCANQEGSLPWVDLGVGRVDAWNNRLRYRVAPSYSRNDVGFGLTSATSLQVCETSACTAITAKGVAAVVLSHGKNGLGAITESGTTNPAPSDADEIQNAKGEDDFVSHTASSTFDDVVSWVPVPILLNRMISAGRLP